MEHLKNFLISAYEKNYYIIVGGDWNQCPPEFSPQFKGNRMDNQNRMDIDRDYLPEWSWAYDPRNPTKRRLSTPYDSRTSLTTVIDYYLVSPNIEVKDVTGIPLDFENSDHQPVRLEILLK